MSEPREAWINPNDYEWSSTEDEGFAKYILFSEYETLRTENEQLKHDLWCHQHHAEELNAQLADLKTENERLKEQIEELNKQLTSRQVP